jgi:DNA-binding NarL/FixJ family response regulator
MHDVKIKIALADDHKLFRKGMTELINGFNNHSVLWEANNGEEVIARLMQPENVPDILLLDINMPLLDGFKTAEWIQENYPQIKILALSMYDDEKTIIKMMKAGARGFILKDAEPLELKQAISELFQKGHYYSELVSSVLMNNISKESAPGKIKLNGREIEFLKLACTEMTYKEIADKMFLAPRTIDGYREALFEKLYVKSRVGLVMYAIRNGIVNIDSRD